MKVNLDLLREMAPYSTAVDMAAAMEVTPQAISYHVRLGRVKPRTGRYTRSGLALNWTPEEDAIIRTGIEKGLTMRVIASRLRGRNRNMVIGRWQRLKKLDPAT